MASSIAQQADAFVQDLIRTSPGSGTANTLLVGSLLPQQIFTTPASQQAWQAHLDSLEDEERVLFLKYASMDLNEYAEYIRSTCLKYKETSRTAKINDLLRPFFRTLGIYLPVAGMASQADPYPSSLVIGGIMCILQISENYSNYQDSFSEWLEKLSRKTAILVQYDICIYQYDDQVQDALVDVYGDILDFCQRALKMVSNKKHPGLRMLGRALRERFSDTFDTVIKDFERHLDIYEQRAKLCNEQRQMKSYYLQVDSALRQRDFQQVLMTLRDDQVQAWIQQRQIHLDVVQNMREQQLMNHETRQFIQDQQKSHRDVMDSIDNGRNEARVFAQQRAAEIEERAREEHRVRRAKKRQRVLDWLPAVDFSDEHGRRGQTLVPGTGQWLLDNKLYKHWKDSSEDDLLWVHGKAGCGKSMLASVALDDLESLRDSGTAVAHFYCSSSDTSKSSTIAIFSSLLRELCIHMTDILPELEEMYDRKAQFQPRGPYLKEITLLLPLVICQLPKTIILVDALDECVEHEVVAKLLCGNLGYGQPTSTMKTILKVIVFSRPKHLAIETAFKDFPQLEVDLGENKEDIRAFITTKLSQDEYEWNDNSSLLNDVTANMLEKANGMFLYVKLLVERLKGSLTPSEIWQELDSLPDDLIDIYDSYINVVTGQKPIGKRDLALKILLWITYARRPLNRDELLVALSIAPKIRDFDEQNRRTKDRDFITICADLITVDGEGFYHLVHSSLRDYLLKLPSNLCTQLSDKRLQAFEAETFLAESCLTYLLFRKFECGPLTTHLEFMEFMEENPLLRYAGENWGNHVRAIKNDPPIDLVWKLLDSENTRNLSMQICLRNVDDVFPFPLPITSLHVLAFFGLLDIAQSCTELLLEAKGCEDGLGNIPLDLAFLNDHLDMTLWLLSSQQTDRGIEHRPQARYSAFHLAVSSQWDSVIDRLISVGYDVDYNKVTQKRTPLMEAARLGYLSTVERFLEAGANVNLMDADGNTALILACGCQRIDVVRKLLDAKAATSPVNRDGLTALHLAVRIRHIGLIKLFLENGAAIVENPEVKMQYTPVHEAAYHNRPDILKIFHEHDSKLSFKNPGEFQPIHAAAANNSLAAAKFIAGITKEINPKIEMTGGTVLHIAVEYSDKEFVEYVLTGISDINEVSDSMGENSLHIAAAFGKTDICKLLLENGANIKAVTTQNCDPLLEAVNRKQFDATKLLLSFGADPNHRDTVDDRALHYAARNGSIEFIHPLLIAGADMEACNKAGESALNLAVENGHDGFVRKLFQLRPHFNPGRVDSNGNTPMHLAATNGFTDIVEILLDHDAPSIPDSSNNLPIHYAAWKGHYDVVCELLNDEIINVRGWFSRTPLAFCAMGGHDSVARLLLEKGADMEVRDDIECTPLIEAIRRNHWTMASLLIQKGANVNVVDKRKFSALHYAARHGGKDFFEQLLAAGGDADVIADYGGSVFFVAVEAGNLEIIKILNGLGINSSKEKTKIGLTPLHTAASHGDLEIMRNVLSSGADLRAMDCTGRTALTYAAREGHYRILEELLTLGLEVNVPETSFSSPLTEACSRGHLEIVCRLIEEKADIHYSNPHNKMTPLMHAASCLWPQVVTKLLASGANPYERNAFGLCALDYAHSHGATFKAMGDANLNYKQIDPMRRDILLRSSIRRCAETLLELSTDLPPAEEISRINHIFTLSTCLLYQTDEIHHELGKYCMMEILYPPEDNLLQWSIECEICEEDLEGASAWVCTTCETILCTSCHTNYLTGDGGSERTAPTAYRLLEKLELEVQPATEIILSLLEDISYRAEALQSIIDLFETVKDWFALKAKEFNEWEANYNKVGDYDTRNTAGKTLFKIVNDMRAVDEKADNKSWGADKDLESVATELSSRLKIFSMEYYVQRIRAFVCSGHEFALVSLELYENLKSSGSVFDQKGRIKNELFSELLRSYQQEQESASKKGKIERGDIASPKTPASDNKSQLFSKDLVSDIEHLSHPIKDIGSIEAQTTDLRQLDIATIDQNRPVVAGKVNPSEGSGLKPLMSPMRQSTFALDSPVLNMGNKTQVLDDRAIMDQTSVKPPAFRTETRMHSITFDQRPTTRMEFEQAINLPQDLQGQPLRRITSPSFSGDESQEPAASIRSLTIPLMEQKIAQPSRRAKSQDREGGSNFAPFMTEEPDPVGIDEIDPLTLSITPLNEKGNVTMMALQIGEAIFPEFEAKYCARIHENKVSEKFGLRLEIRKLSELKHDEKENTRLVKHLR